MTPTAAPSRAEPSRGADAAERFRQFARSECADEPLYTALCNIAAQEPSVLSLLDAAPPQQRRPNLLLAAVHFLLLDGVRHPLASYFPSVGGQRDADAQLHQAFTAFCHTEQSRLTSLIATRTTQTNEVGRCAVLWPALRLAARTLGFEEVALLDFGCSAGLNLGVDRYAYDYGTMRLLPGGANASVQIACRLVGPGTFQIGDASHPSIVSRLGVDPEPIDVRDESAVRWLQACVWPHDATRRQRLGAAIEQAQGEGWCVEQHDDCTSATEAWAGTVPQGVLPVVFNSWVLTYFKREARAQHIERMRTLVQRRGLAWVSAEAPDIRADETLAPPAVEAIHAGLGEGTIWTLMLPGQDSPSSRLIARSHAHGKWMQWLA